MSISIPSFKLLDGSQIPWLGWGNGTGRAHERPIEMGKLALEAGIRHIDTAQGYNNEPETNITLNSTNVTCSEIWLTTKCACHKIIFRRTIKGDSISACSVAGKWLS